MSGDTQEEKQKILLVDDREENLFALENMLQAENREFIRASSGNEALKLVLQHHISLVLLDVQMPEMDGFETAELLRKKSSTRNIPIVFVTAINKDLKYVIKGLEEGAVDYLFKPLEPEPTRAKVTNLLEMVALREKVEVMNAELQQMNEEKNKLLGMAAHDLRSPIGNIKLISEMLIAEAGSGLAEEQKQLLEFIHDLSVSSLNLLSSLLDVSRIESGKLNPVMQKTDIMPLLKRVMRLYRYQSAQKNIKLDLGTDVEELQLNVDPVLIEQAVNNLVSNAIKYSRDGTTINIQLSRLDERACISVTDHGLGIPETELNKLFQFFSRTSVKTTAGESSTGLGLAISRKIVEAHNGTISAKSKEGEGSVFTICLPLPE